MMYQERGESYWLGTLADDGRDVLFQYAPDALARGFEASLVW